MTSPEQNEDFNPDEDRYPDPSKAVEAVLQAEDFPTGPVDRIEIRTTADGSATWRVWLPREDEPIGGFIASP